MATRAHWMKVWLWLSHLVGFLHHQPDGGFPRTPAAEEDVRGGAGVEVPEVGWGKEGDLVQRCRLLGCAVHKGISRHPEETEQVRVVPGPRSSHSCTRRLTGGG